MPFSFEQGKPYIRNIVGRVKHERMLDIGPGSGTYAKLFPEAKWTGVEIFEPYVKKYGLKKLYENIIIEDIRKFDLSPLGRFDVAIAGDVLEHMTAEEAIAVVNKLQSIADTVIVSIPIGHHPQGEWEGNVHETHVVDDWTDEKFREVFGQPTWGTVDGCIGVYCWSNQKVMPKICVYTISKNEEIFVKRWADSAREADLLLIADTGSSDRTVEIAKECGVRVHEICITPWRFDHARNASIALIPKDIDICVCMDVDEILEPGWRQEIERVWTPQTTRLNYFFDWGCGIKFRYEKIHARHGYFWHHPCHEYPVYDKRITEVYAYTDKLLVSHHPDPTKSRGQYLDLLSLSVKEDPNCPRNAFYYARELSFHGLWQDAIDACNRYLNLPGATWDNERCYAYRVMGKCYDEMGNKDMAEKSYHRAAGEAPNTREPWCELAMLMYRQGRWEECFAYSMRALRIVNRDMVYTCDPAVWGHWPHDLASISAWHLGMEQIALDQAKLAADISPQEERLKNNYQWIKNTIEGNLKKIPNIVHFIYFYGPKSRDFSYINYLAVKSAFDVQRPDKIYFYYNEEPKNNIHWDKMKQYVEMVRIDPPTDIGDISVGEWPQRWSDIARLRILYETGGIYLDTDCILVRPLEDLRDNKCVLSGFVGDVSTSVKHHVQSCSAGTIMAEPGSEFIRIWLERLPEGFKMGQWAWQVVDLPVQIYKERPELITMLDMEKFLPFDFNDYRIFDELEAESFIDEIKDCYLIHLWDSLWQNILEGVNEEYLSTKTNALSCLLRRFIF